MLYCRADSCALSRAASRQGGDAAVLRQREPRHQPFDRVQSKPENPKANQRVNHVARAPSPAAFEFGVDFIPAGRMMPPERACRSPRGRGRPRHTYTIHFANTMACGAKFVVAVIVLLGSPPVSWLIANLVMFLDV